MSSFFKSSGSVDTETLPQSGSNVASNTETNTAVSSFFKTSGANSTDEATIQSSVDAAAASATAAANSATSASDSATAAANSAAASSTFTTGGGSVGGDVSITGSLSITGSVDGRDVATDGTKLDGIEAGATADQTDAEIKTAYENNSDTNAFTDALQTKLAGIETGATADQSAAEIRTLVDSATDSNVFTDADHTKLDGIETGADVTDTTNVVAALTAGTNVTIAADGTISSIDTDTTYSNATTSAAGLMSATDKTKLDGVETGATADQTASEIKSAYESNTDTNAFTDADHTKLDGIEANADVTDTTNVVAALTAGTNVTIGADGTISSTDTDTTYSNATTSVAGLMSASDKTKIDGIESGATADQSASEILTAIKTVDGAASGLDADLLDGQHGSYYTGYTDTAVANLVDSAPAALDTLNELAAALGDDANFSTTVTNSIATKLPLAGGTMTGNIVMSGTETVDGRDLSVDGAKLDGIESGATADQTASEILTAIKTVDGAGSGLDADTVDGIQGANFVRSDVNDTVSGVLTLNNYLNRQTNSGNSAWLQQDGTGRVHWYWNTIGGSSPTYNNGNEEAAAITLNGFSSTGGEIKFRVTSANNNPSAGDAITWIEPATFRHNQINLKKNTAVTGNITVTGTVDGRDVAADGTKLDGIESGATADQTKADIDALGIDAATLDSLDSTQFLRSDAADSFSQQIDGTTLELAGGVTYDPPGSSGSDTATDVGLALHSGARVVMGESGYIRTVIDATASQPLQFGQSSTGYFAGSEIYGGSQGVKLFYNTSSKLQTLTGGVSVTGDITVSGTVDGRDVAADGTKLDGIEAGADVTDATNVNAAGAAIFSTTPTANITDGTSGQVLTTNGSGGLSFTTVSGGGGVPSTGGTFTGDVTITSSGTNQSANLMLNNTDTSNNFGKAIEAYRSGIGTGQRQQIMLGKDGSTNDTATLNFYYAGDASSSNRFEVGFWGADSLLNVLANGNVGIGETNPSHKLAVAGDINLTGDLSVGGSVSLTGGGELVVNNGEGITNSKIQVFKQNYFSPNGLDPGEYIELVSITPTSFVSGSHRQFDITGKIIAQSEDSSSAIDVNVRIGLSGFGTFDNTDITYTTTQDADWIEPVLWVNSSTDTVKLLVKAKTQPSGKSGDIDHLTADLTLVRDLNSSTITWNTTVDPTDITAIASGYTETVGKKTIVTIPDGAVELYHNDSKKLETTSTGASVTGELDVSGLLDVEGDIDFEGALVEKAYNLTGTALDPSNGTLQYKTLSANTTFTESFVDGESITLMINDGTDYTVTWPTMTWASGSAPTLATSGYTTVVLWHRGGLYGAVVS